MSFDSTTVQNGSDNSGMNPCQFKKSQHEIPKFYFLKSFFASSNLVFQTVGQLLENVLASQLALAYAMRCFCPFKPHSALSLAL